MVGRISRQSMFMMMARAAAMRSTCFRLNVGAIVTKDNNPVAVGWNGQAPGAPHCEGNDCPGVVPGNCGTIHAEVNALAKAQGLLDIGGPVDLYVTHSPCADCLASLMHGALHVERIFFEVPYRNTNHLGMVHRPYIIRYAGITHHRTTEVYEVTPAGYIVEYFTREVVELR